MTHSEYIHYQHIVKDKVEQTNLEALTQAPSRKFDITNHTPLSYPGITVLAEPFFSHNKHLVTIQKKCQTISGFVAIPPNSLHLTIADIISGENYTKLQEFQKKQLISQTRNYLNDFNKTPFNIKICGISSFPGVVIAVVNFSYDDYLKIIRLRNNIYQNTIARSRFSFLGHITLGYLEKAPPKNLNDTIKNIREEYKFEWDLEINGIDLYFFKNMAYYTKVI